VTFFFISHIFGAIVIPPEFIEEVLSRVDIVEIIEPRVALKKTGQNYSGLCPFHTEKTPSFSVSQEKQFYYCFGCQVSGSALKFLMEFERMEFIAAVEMLAERVGLEVPKSDHQASTETSRRRKTIFEILGQASAYYCEQLRAHPSKERAVGYLKNRGLSGEIARDFALGYSPPGWNNLYDTLANSNFERDLLIESGMVIENKDEDKTYDRFRERIMFPIRDLRGRTIAFGGRIIGDGKPKYLNSPETPVFHKGRELYGLFEARKRNAKLTRVMVVEGYMDVVALAQFGIGYSVATLGTATSKEHIDRLYRLVPQIVFSFDGDSAGRSAAWKALLVTLVAMSDGRSAKFLFLPDGDDPDTLIRKEGKDKFELRLERATPLDEFFFSNLESDLDMDSMEGKATLSKLAMPLLSSIPEGVFKQLMIDALAGKTGLEASRLIQAAGQGQNTATSRSARPPQGSPVYEKRVSEGPGLAELALSMLVQQPELSQEFEDSSYEQLRQNPDARFFGEIALAIRQHELLSPGLLLGHFQGKTEFKSLRSAMDQEQLLDVSELREEFKGTVSTLLDRFETQLKQELKKQLINKPFAELNPEERQLIRDNTNPKSQL
jgi:DNA primase|tara:strand:- start:1067 stop:2887 length:1821 start_codon:yes stop_codon:yes gene_type:complete